MAGNLVWRTWKYTAIWRNCWSGTVTYRRIVSQLDSSVLLLSSDSTVSPWQVTVRNGSPQILSLDQRALSLPQSSHKGVSGRRKRWLRCIRKRFVFYLQSYVVQFPFISGHTRYTREPPNSMVTAYISVWCHVIEVRSFISWSPSPAMPPCHQTLLLYILFVLVLLAYIFKRWNTVKLVIYKDQLPI